MKLYSTLLELFLIMNSSCYLSSLVISRKEPQMEQWLSGTTCKAGNQPQQANRQKIKQSQRKHKKGNT